MVKTNGFVNALLTGGTACTGHTEMDYKGELLAAPVVFETVEEAQSDLESEVADILNAVEKGDIVDAGDALLLQVLRIEIENGHFKLYQVFKTDEHDPGDLIEEGSVADLAGGFDQNQLHPNFRKAA